MPTRSSTSSLSKIRRYGRDRGRQWFRCARARIPSTNTHVTRGTTPWLASWLERAPRRRPRKKPRRRARSESESTGQIGPRHSQFGVSRRIHIRPSLDASMSGQATPRWPASTAAVSSRPACTTRVRLRAVQAIGSDLSHLSLRRHCRPRYVAAFPMAMRSWSNEHARVERRYVFA
jgi:hypothetical protein